MGPACGGAKGTREIEIPKQFSIHGHIIDSQTRSLVMACNVAGKTFILNSIDFVKQANIDTRYLAVNPTGHIPMIEEGHYKVLGGSHIIYVFLCKHAH